jgi:hypothetical protein
MKNPKNNLKTLEHDILTTFYPFQRIFIKQYYLLS